MSKHPDDTASEKRVIWFSRILRWTLGVFFIGAGIMYYTEGAWPAIMLGVVFIVTGFFRPTHCLGGSCAVPPRQPSQTAE
ncbi:MAG: DUF2892 domain-containing protein [Chitinophagaceae bacterium]|nr:DUF2892 domain-containing protein [Chitinophagaceae bacterium]